MFSRFRPIEVWEVSVCEGWFETVVGMGGEEWSIPINEGETGIAKVYKDGSIKVKFDNVYEPPNGGKLVVWVNNQNLLNWNLLLT